MLLSRKEFVPMEISSAESQADTMSLLPDKTPNGITLALLGILPLETVIHKNALNLFTGSPKLWHNIIWYYYERACNEKRSSLTILRIFWICIVKLLYLSPPIKIFCRPFLGGASFMDHFSRVLFMLLVLSCFCLFIAVLWSPAAKGLASWLSCMLYAAEQQTLYKEAEKLPKTKIFLLSSKIAKKGECSAPLMSFNF